MRLLFLGLCLAGLFAACSEKEETASLHVSATEFTWDATVREQTLTVATPTYWTLKSDVDWCNARKSSGSSGAQINLWVSPNLTAQQRTGTLTISSGGAVKFVKITQPAYTGDVDKYEYVLPVIFHVLYKDEADEQQNVRKGWLASLLAMVNNLYKSNNVGLTFEMATYDQDGEELEEPGVMRHKVNFDEFDPSQFLSGIGEADNLAQSQQHLRRYINVYVFRFNTDGVDGTRTLGISSMPLMPTTHPLDSLTTVPNVENYTQMTTPWGVCINNVAIYTVSGRIYYPEDASVTLAHELGHYVGLLHTFSEVECLYDDACSDTPICDYTAYREQVSKFMTEYTRRYGSDYRFSLDQLALRENCQEAGKTYVADNIMDYNYCYSNTFTAQQRARIRYVLNYAPLVPGPKLDVYKVKGATRSASSLRPVLSDCPSISDHHFNVVP